MIYCLKQNAQRSCKSGALFWLNPLQIFFLGIFFSNDSPSNLNLIAKTVPSPSAYHMILTLLCFFFCYFPQERIIAFSPFARCLVTM